MAVNGDEIDNAVGEDTHGANSYFEAFAGIVAALDALAKAVTPDADDDGTPPDEIPPPSCNSYFESFRAIQDALGRLKAATEERLADMTENDPTFAAWKDAYSIGLGKGASPASNGIAIGWNSTAGSGTGTGARDSGAVAVGKAASALGIDAVAIGRGAVAGASGARTTKATVQLGSGTNTADGTLQFRDWQIVDASGTIPAERLSLSSLEFRTTTITRAASGFCNINDHAVNSITLDGQTVSFVLPAEQTGRARAFILRLTMQSATTWGFPPSSLVFESDDEDVFREIEVGATATLSFFEVSHRCFIVSRKDTKAVAKPEIPI